VDPLSSSTRP